MKDPVKIIFIDCQTTGPSPQSSSLLEVGWNESSWVLAQEVPVSPKALKLVGIPQNEVDLGVSRKDLWILLEKSLAVIKPD
ncbi:MAG: hypothetical protein NTV34_12505, partial [Proteobacteria bacterium]|nr:hypothetical protein [Pseudomonadota bacterium]